MRTQSKSKKIMPPATIDFSLRPNKAIERKLIFDALACASASFPWSRYQYIGFGALWFRDFLLAHRTLGIKRLHSIEAKSSIAARAKRNRPLKCIEVYEGLASKVLLDQELRLAERRAIIWLDYDSRATADLLKDLDRVFRDVPVGSVVLATFNAAPQSLGDDAHARLQALTDLFGAWVPDPPPEGYLSKSLDKFPFQLAQLVMGRAVRTVQARLGLKLAPLFNFAYSDNAPMITVGGMIVDDKASTLLEASGIRRRLGVIRSPTFDLSSGWPRLTDQCRIDVPILTRLERLKLNRNLPGKLSETRVAQLCGSGLTLGERDSYARFYNYLPAFAEFEL